MDLFQKSLSDLPSPGSEIPTTASLATNSMSSVGTFENSESEEVLARMAEASSLRQVIGALVFSSPTPLSAETIRASIRNQKMEEGEKNPFAHISLRDVTNALNEIAKDFHRLALGIDLVEVADGWRYQTQPGCGKWVRSLLKVDKPMRLSKSALETLSIIAYRQPIARSEIEGIRGVAVDHVIRALTEMHLIRMVGRSDLPGKPFLYGTTPLFLEHFGLKSLNDLEEIDPDLSSNSSFSPKKKPSDTPELF